MASLDWSVAGVEIANCNCNWGCPCQFYSLPSSGQCEAVWGMRIEQGHYAGTSLDGLAWGFLVWWPGAVHEGNGKLQVFGEARATPAQRQALEAIAHGEVSAEGSYFNIFSAMAPNFQPSVWAPVQFECDVDARIGKLVVDGLVDCRIEPIRNPITHETHRAKVALPAGFEYREAEFASGNARSSGPIALAQADSHAHLARVAWNAAGLIA